MGERKSPVYLDLNFWIRLADANLKSGDKGFEQLLGAMRKARSKFFCPISAAHVFELGKIGDESRRKSRIDMMEEFSNGLCITPPFELLSLEIENAAYEYFQVPEEGRLDVGSLAFRPIRFVTGQFQLDYSPLAKALTVQELEQIKKEFERGMEKMSVRELLEALNQEDAKRAAFEQQEQALADATNKEKKKRLDAGTKLSRKQEWEEQFKAFVLSWQSFVTMTIVRLKVEGVDLYASIPKFIQSPGFRRMPFLYVWTTWMTAEMMNLDRTSTANDFFDWQHVCAAMPYTDIFATEAYARHLLCQELKLDAEYGTKVVNNAADLRTAIEGL